MTYKCLALAANVTQSQPADVTVYWQPTTHYTHALHEVLDCHILNNDACLGVNALVRFAFESGSARTRPLGSRMIRMAVERKGMGRGRWGEVEGCGGGRWRGRCRFPNMYVCLTIVRETPCVGGREGWEEGGVGMGGERSTRPWNEPHRFAWNDPPPMGRPPVNNYVFAFEAV